jgi:hypothetical protein
MAVERQRGGAGTGSKPKPGGNTPKPGGNTPKPRPGTSSAKEASRAQSRPVSGRGPAGKGGGGGKGGQGGRGGNTPRPGNQRQAAAGPRGRSGGLIAWGAVGLVVVVVVVIVVVKVAGGNSNANASFTPVTPAPASIVSDVTNIPASVYDTVGVNIPSVAQANPPIVLSNQPALTLSGKTPAVFYYGAEYCPYCAAERWALTAALSRFGTWSNLDVTASSHTDVDPATPTFSYRNATFTSQFVSFFPDEQYTNIPSGSGYTTLKNPTTAEQAVLTKYSSPTFIPSDTTPGSTSFPFIDIGNQALVSGAGYNPQMLAGLSHNDIASHLNDPTNTVTQAIVGTANYITAAICASTNMQPSSVCTSSGVQAAASALKLG